MALHAQGWPTILGGNINIRLTTDINSIDWNELVQIFELAPLGKRRDPKHMETAFRNSTLRIFAFDDSKLIGAGRALSDGIYRAAIYDVVVLPEYQGQGIGSQLIRHLVQAAKVDVIILYAAPGKEDYYTRFGFKRMNTAMAIMSDENSARLKGLIE